MLGHDNVDLAELRAICDDIVGEDHRATEVMRRMRALVSKQPPTLEPLDVQGVIGDVVRLVHGNAVLRQCRVLVEAAPGLPPVMGDRIELQQVVLNLLVNAFDAMSNCPADDREASVRAACVEGGVVRVSVSDHGTGVAAGEVERIFDPFHTTKDGGLGIGLSISRTIIASHGGRLWAENNPDRGATFFFTVPVADARRKR